MSSRKPAPIVKCEHCSWKGSARGLFTHVRLSHPGITSKPPIASLKHPLDINNKTIGSTSKRKRYRSSIDDDALLNVFGIMLAIKVLESLTDSQKQTLQREGINPSKVVTALGKIH